MEVVKTFAQNNSQQGTPVCKRQRGEGVTDRTGGLVLTPEEEENGYRCIGGTPFYRRSEGIARKKVGGGE